MSIAWKVPGKLGRKEGLTGYFILSIDSITTGSSGTFGKLPRLLT